MAQMTEEALKGVNVEKETIEEGAESDTEEFANTKASDK